MSACRLLALDIASNTGAAWGSPGERPVYTSVKFTRDGEAGSFEGVKEAAARGIQWIADLTKVEKFDRAVIEAPIPETQLHGNTNVWASALKFALIGVLGGGLSCRGVPVDFANIQAVRKFVIGRGNVAGAQAKPAVRVVCRALGWTPNNFDEADALALWLYDCSRVDPRATPRLDPISLGIPPFDFEQRRPSRREPRRAACPTCPTPFSGSTQRRRSGLTRSAAPALL